MYTVHGVKAAAASSRGPPPPSSGQREAQGYEKTGGAAGPRRGGCTGATSRSLMFCLNRSTDMTSVRPQTARLKNLPSS
jgi:hypothetical protein